MISLSNSTVSSQNPAAYFPWADTRGGMPAADYRFQWVAYKTDAPTDLSTATWAGRVADIIALMIDSSGVQQVYIVEFKRYVNEEGIKLLQMWIEQYGSDRHPDLDKQLEELNVNRLSFRS
jgi:hypothetical protein